MKSTQNKGVTLIALVITIIIMMILAGVVIDTVLEGGLFGQTQKATLTAELVQIKEKWGIAREERAHSDIDEFTKWPNIDIGRYEGSKTVGICWDDRYIYFIGEQQPDKDIAIKLGYKTEVVQPENSSDYTITMGAPFASPLVNMEKGNTYTITVSVSSNHSNKNVEWYSSNPSILSIDKSTGKFTANKVRYCDNYGPFC